MKKFFRLTSVMLVYVMLFSCVTAGAINFREYTCIYPGDADGNCKIDVNDVTNIQKYVANSIADEEMCLPCSDINGDGKINIKDATETQRKIVGLDYNCFVYPDEEYLHTDGCIKPEGFSDKHKIDFERIYTSRDYISGIPFRQNSGVSLITNPGEFMSLMGYYYECFDDEYFEEKALIMAFGQAYDDQIEFSVNTVGIVDNGLYVDTVSKFMGDDPTLGMPTAPKWIMIYSVNKSDIENVNRIY